MDLSGHLKLVPGGPVQVKSHVRSDYVMLGQWVMNRTQVSVRGIIITTTCSPSSCASLSVTCGFSPLAYEKEG
ncbi:hypothetical protein E2C01_012424 [Portunus trituberculatus]|uniref:Uncharacterized protein n=1 Tax=Portunus trituberculatus TaxID=210409 RepID=A0A5B7DE49_PORTR|nr:hypothetical protein [Portunus trituberculatus]